MSTYNQQPAATTSAAPQSTGQNFEQQARKAYDSVLGAAQAGWSELQRRGNAPSTQYANQHPDQQTYAGQHQQPPTSGGWSARFNRATERYGGARGASDGNPRKYDLLMYLVAIFIPPVPVLLKVGLSSAHFWANLVLLLFVWIPAVIHAWYIIASKRTLYFIGGGSRPVGQDTYVYAGQGHAPLSSPHPQPLATSDPRAPPAYVPPPPTHPSRSATGKH